MIIYKESTLYQNFIYPRYISEMTELSPLSMQEDPIVPIEREDELWWQKSKLENGLSVKDSTVDVMSSNDTINYVSHKIDTYFREEKETHVLDDLLDDKQCMILFACGTYYGNTNTDSRIKKEIPSVIENTEYTLALKRIWGFEPEMASSYEDISDGLINGFSKKYYTILVTKDSDDNIIYLPTVKGKPLSEAQIETIVAGKDGNNTAYQEYYEQYKTIIVSD